jgi:O-acetyl-ADP-ribose deacetylase
MISTVLGDITKMPTQAVVNSANPSLLAGGGVCGAIHRAAGPELEAVCKQLGRIDPGKAVLTRAFNLPAQYVIHAVAPRYWDGSRGEVEVLAETYCSICGLVEQYKITSITIPSIGTGIYRFPLELAAKTAIFVMTSHLPQSCSFTFVCFDDITLKVYQDALLDADKLKLI